MTDQAPTRSPWCECGYEPPCASDCPATTPPQAEPESDLATLTAQLSAERAAHARTKRWLEHFQTESVRKTIEAMRLNTTVRLLRMAIAATLPHLPDDVRAGIDSLLEWLDKRPGSPSAAASVVSCGK